MPIAGVTALQALQKHGNVQPGQKVVINGAGGGVGTFAVQIAKALGAEVTAVTSTDKLDLMRTLGADHVIDYGRADFTRDGDLRYDLVIDVGANRSVRAMRRRTRAGRSHHRCRRRTQRNSRCWDASSAASSADVSGNRLSSSMPAGRIRNS